MYSQLFARKALTPAAGAAATVASLGFFHQQVSTRASARVATRTVQTAANRLLVRQQQPMRAARYFSSKVSTEKVGVVPPPPAATVTATSTSSSFSFLQWYEGHLTARPVLTKMVTGSILWSIGDAVAQIVPHLASDKADSKGPLEYDFPRTGRAAFFGFAIHAPTSHVHFNFLEYMTQRAGVTGLTIPVFKAFMEQFVYWSWFSNSLYHGTMGLMQGQTLEQSYQRICDVLWETQKAQWVFWIPIQLLNFRFVPVRHQLNVVLLTSIVWTALLSAWYPPTAAAAPAQDGNEKKQEILEGAAHD